MKLSGFLFCKNKKASSFDKALNFRAGDELLTKLMKNQLISIYTC
jgi:hypothetical protein